MVSSHLIFAEKKTTFFLLSICDDGNLKISRLEGKFLIDNKISLRDN